MDAITCEVIKTVSENVVLVVFSVVMALVVLRLQDFGADEDDPRGNVVDSEVGKADVEDGEDEDKPESIRLDADRLLQLAKWVLITCVVCLCVGFLAGVFVMRVLQ